MRRRAGMERELAKRVDQRVEPFIAGFVMCQECMSTVWLEVC